MLVDHTLQIRFCFLKQLEIVIKHGGRNGVLIEGEKGRIFVSRRTLDGAPVKALEDNPLPEDAIQKVYKGLPMEGNGACKKICVTGCIGFYWNPKEQPNGTQEERSQSS